MQSIIINFLKLLVITICVLKGSRSEGIQMNLEKLPTEILGDKFSTFVISKINNSEHIKNIHVVIPIEKGNDNILSIIDKTLQKMSVVAPTSVDENYICDAKGNNLIKPLQWIPMIQHIVDLYLIPILDTGREVSNLIYCLDLQLGKMGWENFYPLIFNPRAHFFFVILIDKCGYPDPDGRKSEWFFNYVWSKNLLSSSIAILSTCDLEINIITAQPFTKENPGRKVNAKAITNLRYPLNLEDFDFRNSFKAKDIQNFNNSVFRLGTVPSPPYVMSKDVDKMSCNDLYGIDIEFMNLLSSRRNFTIEFYKTDGCEMDAWFKKLPNGTWVGILQEVKRHRVDIGFGGNWPSYLSYFKYDYYSSYSFSSFLWYVPDASPMPGWMINILVFPTEVWLISGVVLLIACATYSVLDWLLTTRFRPFDGPPFKLQFADFLRLNLGFSSTLYPKNVHLRIVLIFWTAYSINWYTVYSSVLFVLASNPPMEKEILTFEDLHDSRMTVSISTIHEEIFRWVDIGKNYKEVLGNHMVCEQFKSCVHNLYTHRNFSMLSSEALEYEVDIKRAKIHKLSEAMIRFPVSYITSKGNPLSYTINDMLLRSFQAGLMLKWESTARLLLKETSSTYDTSDDDRSQPVNLYGAFIILICGLTASFIVFLVECTVQ